MEKDLEYWKNNAEEDYLHVPISVLRYITELEKTPNLPTFTAEAEKELAEKLISQPTPDLMAEEETPSKEDFLKAAEEESGRLYRILDNPVFQSDHVENYENIMKQIAFEHGANWAFGQLHGKTKN